MNKTDIKSCSRCLLNSRFPGIKFDKNNLCSECVKFERMWGRQIDDPEYLEKTNLKLKKILMNSKKSRSKFDCAIAASGGLDSLRIIDLIKSKYGLNPLVITVDNAFLNPQAKKNLNKVISQLGVEHIYCNPNIHKSLHQHFLLKSGVFCNVCVYTILINVAKIAYENNIKLLVFGMSKRQDAFLPYGTNIFTFLNLKDKSLFLLFFYVLFGKVINLPDYIEWDTVKIKQDLEKKYSITLGEEHSDCLMHDFAKWLAYKRYGFSQVTLKYCQLIRNRRISRSEAQEEVDKIEGQEPKDLKYFLEYFAIRREDIDNAIKNAKKLDSGLVNRISQFMRRLYFQAKI